MCRAEQQVGVSGRILSCNLEVEMAPPEAPSVGPLSRPSTDCVGAMPNTEDDLFVTAFAACTSTEAFGATADWRLPKWLNITTLAPKINHCRLTVAATTQLSLALWDSIPAHPRPTIPP